MLHRMSPQASQDSVKWPPRALSCAPCSTGSLARMAALTALTRTARAHVPLKHKLVQCWHFISGPPRARACALPCHPPPSVSCMPSIQAAIFSICGVTGLFCCRMRSSILAPGPCFACPLPGPPLPACPGAPRPLGPAGLPLQCSSPRHEVLHASHLTPIMSTLLTCGCVRTLQGGVLHLPKICPSWGSTQPLTLHMPQDHEGGLPMTQSSMEDPVKYAVKLNVRHPGMDKI